MRKSYPIRCAVVASGYHRGGRVEETITEREVSKVDRFWEVDAARGVAILMMVLYHLTYDLDTFGGYAIDSTSGLWALFADATATLFLFLVGVSLIVSFAKSGGRGTFGKFLRRGLRVFGYGLIVTVVTWFLGMGLIVFGILHLIGACVILAYPFLRHRNLSLVVGLAVIAAGAWLMSQNIVTQSPWLLPFGVVPEGLFMPDYRPLLPWFGVVLLGIFVGSLIYGGVRRPGGRTPPWARPVGFLGRWSLGIYLVHQPVLVAVLGALGVIELNF